MRLALAARGIILGSWLLLLLSGSLMLGCEQSPGSAPEATLFLPRTSPENLLQNLKTAYREQAWAEFESLFAEDFTFYFADEDQSLPEVPEFWGRSAQFDHCSRLFDVSCVTSLSLEFVYTLVRFDAEHFDGVDSIWLAEVNDIALDIWERPECHPDAEPEHCCTEGGAADFRFRERAWQDETGEPIWTIVDILADSAGTSLCFCPPPGR